MFFNGRVKEGKSRSACEEKIFRVKGGEVGRSMVTTIFQQKKVGLREFFWIYRYFELFRQAPIVDTNI